MKGKKTGGRKAGTPNRSTAEVKDMARMHAPDALAELARLARGAESEAARVAACREILDRAYGKAPQAIVGDPDAPVEHRITEIRIRVVDPTEGRSLS